MVDAYGSECPATQRSGTWETMSERIATVLLEWQPEEEDCAPMTVRAPYTAAILAAEMVV